MQPAVIYSLIIHPRTCSLLSKKNSSRNQTAEANQKIENFAKSCNVCIKNYHADNRMFISKVLKDRCIANQKTWSFYGVNAHCQNGVDEIKISTVMSLDYDVLFNTMIKWPSVAYLWWWPFAAQCVIEILNNTSKYCDFTPK